MADMVSCLPGCTGQQGDANQAFPQAVFKGIETWIEIPRSRWPRSWHAKKWKPVCKLLCALYGHPESGGYWEQHCEAHLVTIGFQVIPDWPSILAPQVAVIPGGVCG